MYFLRLRIVRWLFSFSALSCPRLCRQHLKQKQMRKQEQINFKSSHQSTVRVLIQTLRRERNCGQVFLLPSSNKEKSEAEKDCASNAAFFFASYRALLLCSPTGLEDFGSRQQAAVGTYTYNCSVVISIASGLSIWQEFSLFTKTQGRDEHSKNGDTINRRNNEDVLLELGTIGYLRRLQIVDEASITVPTIYCQRGNRSEHTRCSI